MDVTVELEDDLFFADLSKQISLLIMDEDEDPLACPAHTLQVFSLFPLTYPSTHHSCSHFNLILSLSNYSIF